MKYLNFILAVVCFFIPVSSIASDLVSTDWLKNNSHTVKIIDLRKSEAFQTGHIPSAINIPYSQFTRSKDGVAGFVETPKAFKKLMERNGIGNEDSIVLYSDWSFLDSMRVYWVFDFYGHKKIKVLDGGIQAWSDHKQELSLKTNDTKTSEYVIEINSDIIATKFRTLMASKNDRYVIVDGRDSPQYKGEKSLTKRKGHIPQAINLPWLELVKNRSVGDEYNHIQMPSTLEDVETLKQKLSDIPSDKEVILYCNGGQESSVIYFALKELGIKSSVYDGSWYEWSNDESLPVINKTN